MNEGSGKESDAEAKTVEEQGVDLDQPQGEGAATVEEGAIELQRARSEAAEFKDKYLRALADFENYKKRVLKERAELLKYQGDKILADLLEVLDNLERALVSSESDPSGLREGVTLIHKLFIDTLARWEVRPESALGKAFDPAKHTAVSRVSVDGVAPGSVVSELRKTYFYRDRLLRPAEVVVAAEREQAQSPNRAETSGEA